MVARIYQPTKNAMQSGRGHGQGWILQIERNHPSLPNDFIGWSGSNDTSSQVHMNFETQQAAVAFAVHNGIAYQIFTPKERKIKPKSYADNFAFDRLKPWTH